MSPMRNAEAIRVGVLTYEAMRMAGLASIFDDHQNGKFIALVPGLGKSDELLSDPTLAYLIVDLDFPPGGMRSLEAIRRRRPDMQLIALGQNADDHMLLDLIGCGVRAYLDLHSSPETICKAVEAVVSGSIWAPRRVLSKIIEKLLRDTDGSLGRAGSDLTSRERQVQDLLLLAHSNREIADQLGIDERTVQAHVGRLMRKAGVENRTELSVRALKRQLAPGSGSKPRPTSQPASGQNPARPPITNE